jgi:hypothetical protein
VQSVMRRLPNAWKNPWQDLGYTWSLFKVREGRHKGEHGGDQVESGGQESVLPFLGTFKTYACLWEGLNQLVPIQ